MKTISAFFILSILFFSCKPNSSSDTASEGPPADVLALEAQVMAIHDEVMPRINEMGHLSTQLRNIRAGLEETPEGRKEVPEGLDDVMKTLKLAEQGMWDWMKSYSDTKATLSEEQLKPFLKKEVKKIEKVKQDMLDSIEKAQAWLAAHPSGQ